MINSFMSLKFTLDYEKKIYWNEHNPIKEAILCEPYFKAYKYVRLLRYVEYFHSKKGLAFKILYVLTRRKKNRLGTQIGIEIWDGSAAEGLLIYHPQGVVINCCARIGKNCKIHGNNCIGNIDTVRGKAPVIGNNVEIGVGAKIIGDIYIADNIKIGAGAVVTKSFYEEGITLVGIPAKPYIKV